MTVLVGVDGSPSALDAVRLGVMEARWRDRPLRIVHAFIWPWMNVPVGPLQDGPTDGGLRHDAEQVLAEAIAVANVADPTVRVSTELVTGAPVPVLLRAAEDADLVVIGNRGLGGFSGLLIGSVAVQVAAYGSVPVLVAKNHHRSLGPVVVGIDGAGDSAAALDIALQEASYRQAELVAVHTWTGPAPTRSGDVLSPVDLLRDEEERVLAEALAGHAEHFPDVKIGRQAIPGRAAKTLVHLSTEAQLIVVGARGRGGFTGLLLGSVSQQVLHHASCPVLIVPRRTGGAS